MYEGAIQDLIDELGRLPGVGPKGAQRIAFHLLATEPADVERLASTLLRVKNEVKFCTICGNVAQADVRSDSCAATLTSISRAVVTVMKYGWFGIGGRLRPYLAGFSMMSLTACSFGT